MDELTGFHLGMGGDTPYNDVLRLDVYSLQFLYGHSMDRSHMAALATRNNLFMRKVAANWGGLEDWLRPDEDERQSLATYMHLQGKQMFEVGFNEPLPGTDWEAYGRWSGYWCNDVWDNSNGKITPVVFNASVGTTNQQMVDAFARGLAATKRSEVLFVLGVHEGAALAYRMWFGPGWQGEEINTVDIKQPWPTNAELKRDLPWMLEDGMWLWCRILKYIAPIAAIPGFQFWHHTETALDRITSNDWNLIYDWATGIHAGFSHIWQSEKGITDVMVHYAWDYSNALRAAAYLSKLMGVKYGGGNLWIVYPNWEFDRHDIAGAGVRAFHNLMPERPPLNDPTAILQIAQDNIREAIGDRFWFLGRWWYLQRTDPSRGEEAIRLLESLKRWQR